MPNYQLGLFCNCPFSTACVREVLWSYLVLTRRLLTAVHNQPLCCLSAGLVYCTQITAKLANARLNVSRGLMAESSL